MDGFGRMRAPQRMADAVEAWNLAHPEGTEVIYWPVKFRSGRRTVTTGPAFLAPKGIALISVEGTVNFVALDRVQARAGMATEDGIDWATDFSHRW
jgi:hypothetical protein